MSTPCEFICAGAGRINSALLRLGHPLGSDVLAEVRRDRGEPSLVLEEVCLLRERLGRRAVGAAAEPCRGGLLLKAWETVERHRIGDIFGLRARPLGDRGYLGLIGGP